MERMTETKSRAICMCKSVVLSYVVTLFLLLIISFVMLQTGVSKGAVTVAVILTYIISVFAGSFYVGRHVEKKRYLWGLVAALIYYLVYILISLIVKGDTPVLFTDYIKSFVIIACSGMLGGMLS